MRTSPLYHIIVRSFSIRNPIHAKPTAEHDLGETVEVCGDHTKVASYPRESARILPIFPI